MHLEQSESFYNFGPIVEQSLPPLPRGIGGLGYNSLMGQFGFRGHNLTQRPAPRIENWENANLPDPTQNREPHLLFVPRIASAAKPIGTQLILSPGPIPEQEWLSLHENEYRGQWVALEGSRLIANGVNGGEVFREAKAAGVQSPFLVHIEKDPLPFGGW